MGTCTERQGLKCALTQHGALSARKPIKTGTRSVRAACAYVNDERDCEGNVMEETTYKLYTKTTKLSGWG